MGVLLQVSGIRAKDAWSVALASHHARVFDLGRLVCMRYLSVVSMCTLHVLSRVWQGVPEACEQVLSRYDPPPSPEIRCHRSNCLRGNRPREI